jgi:hypothetical protein
MPAGISTRARLGWPTGERLQRSDPRRFALLVQWRDLMQPAGIGGEPDPADDGRAMVINRTDRPDDGEIIAAWLRPTYVTLRHRRGRWEHPARRADGGMTLAGRVHLGGLVFNGEDQRDDGPRRGEMVQWGHGRHEPLTPYEKLTLSHRGGRRKTPPGTRQRKAVDTGGDWDGLHQSPAVSLDDQRGEDAFTDVARQTEARIARKAVGARHADILDFAISSATAQKIGEAFDYSGEYAEKKGVRLVNEALDVFGSIAAPLADNDNNFSEEVKIAA